MAIRVSVIIPVYNAEKTICRCLDSLTCQNSPEVEIILINDGSTDKSRIICESYADRFKCIKVINQDNRGVSAARNEGLSRALGEYIAFVDSDDYVSADFFQTILACLNQKDWDLMQFSYCYRSKQKKRKRELKQKSVIGSEKIAPAIITAICKKTINPPWAKVYKTSIIKENSLCFPKVSIGEDRAFNIKYSMYCSSYAEYHQAIYNVCLDNESSLSRKRHKDINRQFEIGEEFILDSINNAPVSPQIKTLYTQAVNFGECRGVYYHAKQLHRDGLSVKERLKHIGQLCDDVNAKRMEYPNLIYCKAIVFPIRFRLIWLIDAMAWKLTH